MRTKHPRVRLFAVLLSMAALLAAAAPVQAADRGFVDVQGCSWFEGGKATVPAGTEFDLFAGWIAATRGQELAWLDSVQTTLTIDGSPVADADNWWSEPFQVDKKFWIVVWVYPHAALRAGQSITVYHAWSLDVPVFDGSFHYPAGEIIFDATCTITARGGRR
ncbi:MAG: hypothetical protein ABI458_04545 [Chloroflexota bacterium]